MKNFMQKHNVGFSIIFTILLYLIFGFSFGTGNNLEELPLIYGLKGELLADPFVNYHLTHFNPATPYIYFTYYVSSIFPISISTTFFLIHLVSVYLLIFFCIKLSELVGSSKLLFSGVFLLTLVLLANKTIFNNWNFIPNGRSLYYNFADPEFLSVSLLIPSMYYYLKSNYSRFGIYIFLATLAHPLYSIILIPSILLENISATISKRKTLQEMIVLFACILPIFIYTLALLALMEDSIFSKYLISLQIRAPYHFEIPTFERISFIDLRFFSFTLLTGIFAMLSFAKLNNPARSLVKIIFFQIGILFLAFVIYNFFEPIPILINLTIFRIGTITTLLCLIAVSLIIKVNSNRFSRLVLYSFIFFLILANINYQKLVHMAQFPFMNQPAATVGTQLPADKIYLNISDKDIRSSFLLSDYFSFKNYYLDTHGQSIWYLQLLATINQSNQPISCMSQCRSKYLSKQHLNIHEILSSTSRQIGYLAYQEKYRHQIIVDSSDITEMVDFGGLKYYKITYLQ
jgi:hypothetical protein